MAAGGHHLWAEEDETQRAGLFRSAKAGAGKSQAGATPGVRTAEDIKAAYGRPSTTKRCDLLKGCAARAGPPYRLASSLRSLRCVECKTEHTRQCLCARTVPYILS